MTITTRRLVVWHLLAAPLTGAVVATGVYTLLLRPMLPWPAWMLDVLATACGAVGLLAGGVLGFRWAPEVTQRERALTANRPRWATPAMVGFSSVALVASMLLAGVPVSGPAGVVAALCAMAVAALMVRRL
jgi:hypothetical protein